MPAKLESRKYRKRHQFEKDARKRLEAGWELQSHEVKMERAPGLLIFTPFFGLGLLLFLFAKNESHYALWSRNAG